MIIFLLGKIVRPNFRHLVSSVDFPDIIYKGPRKNIISEDDK